MAARGWDVEDDYADFRASICATLRFPFLRHLYPRTQPALLESSVYSSSLFVVLSASCLSVSSYSSCVRPLSVCVYPRNGPHPCSICPIPFPHPRPLTPLAPFNLFLFPSSDHTSRPKVSFNPCFVPPPPSPRSPLPIPSPPPPQYSQLAIYSPYELVTTARPRTHVEPGTPHSSSPPYVFRPPSPSVHTGAALGNLAFFSCPQASCLPASRSRCSLSGPRRCRRLASSPCTPGQSSRRDSRVRFATRLIAPDAHSCGALATLTKNTHA